LKAESALKVLVGLPLYEHKINKRFES
jgi:hypothetical protein